MADRRQYQKEWYQANRIRLKAKDRARYLADKDAIDAKNKAWAEQHQDRMRELKNQAQKKPRSKANRANHESLRRARKSTTEVEFVDRNTIFARDEGRCGICGGLVDPCNWHLDHITPLACGGTHTADNVQVSHPTCNLVKGGQG